MVATKGGDAPIQSSRGNPLQRQFSINPGGQEKEERREKGEKSLEVRESRA